jgi:holo-[acyl-carrier protein] synthase
MKIITVGTDLVDVERLRKSLEQRSPGLRDRLFTDREWAYCEAQAKPHTSLAARMAAKEAIRKIFGQWGYDDVNWKETEVAVRDNGAPYVVLHGIAAERATHCSFALSLSHTDTLAQAFCIAYDCSPNE